MKDKSVKLTPRHKTILRYMRALGSKIHSNLLCKYYISNGWKMVPISEKVFVFLLQNNLVKWDQTNYWGGLRIYILTKKGKTIKFD